MYVLLLSALAIASECPDLGAAMGAAWAAFNDAELEEAMARLDEATGALPCQDRLVDTSELIGLFQLEGLVALAQEDRSGAIYATIRIVTTDPEARPAEDVGPEFQELHATWTERLAASRVQLVWRGEGSAWVDGRPLRAGESTSVIAGEHLIQVQRPDGWLGVATDVAHDASIRVDGKRIVLGPVAVAPEVAPAPTPEPVPEKRTRRGGPRLGLVVSGGLAVAAGAASIAYGFDREQRFAADPYDDPVYGGCATGTGCYEAARATRIRSDAMLVNGLYGGGYGLAGVGIALLGLELFVLPAPASGGGSVRVRVDW